MIKALRQQFAHGYWADSSGFLLPDVAVAVLMSLVEGCPQSARQSIACGAWPSLAVLKPALGVAACPTPALQPPREAAPKQTLSPFGMQRCQGEDPEK